MINTLITSLRMLLVLTVLTGAVYPLLVTAFGQLFFPNTANGSLIIYENKVVGSDLIAQKFTSPQYFYSRPSASDFGTIPSGASNLGPTSKVLKDALIGRQKSFGNAIPDDLVTTSASGLDPHISPDAAYSQIERISSARNLNEEQKQKLQKLLRQNTEKPIFGFLGKTRVNVLALNLILDREFP